MHVDTPASRQYPRKISTPRSTRNSPVVSFPERTRFRERNGAGKQDMTRYDRLSERATGCDYVLAYILLVHRTRRWGRGFSYFISCGLSALLTKYCAISAWEWGNRGSHSTPGKIKWYENRTKTPRLEGSETQWPTWLRSPTECLASIVAPLFYHLIFCKSTPHMVAVVPPAQYGVKNNMLYFYSAGIRNLPLLHAACHCSDVGFMSCLKFYRT